MQLSDLIALAALLRPPPGPQIPMLAKSSTNVTGLTIGRAALNAPSDNAPQMLGAMIGASEAPANIAIRQAMAEQARQQTGFLQQLPSALENAINAMSGASTGASVPMTSSTPFSGIGSTASGTEAPSFPSSSMIPGGALTGSNWEIQNNNFGGLRKPGVFAGPSAGGFQSFGSPEEGIAAISHQLDRYASGATTGKQLDTIRKIVSTWAPPSENPTDALIRRASSVVGVGADQPLDVSDPNTKAKLIEATIRNEQGGMLPVDPSLIYKVAQAGSNSASAPAPASQPFSMAPAQSASSGAMDSRQAAIVRLGVMSRAAKMGDIAQPLEQAYYNSPAFKAQVKAAEENVGLQFEEPKAYLSGRGSAAAAYLRPENNPKVVQDLAAARTAGEQDGIMRAAGIDPNSDLGKTYRGYMAAKNVGLPTTVGGGPNTPLGVLNPFTGNYLYQPEWQRQTVEQQRQISQNDAQARLEADLQKYQVVPPNAGIFVPGQSSGVTGNAAQAPEQVAAQPPSAPQNLTGAGGILAPSLPGAEPQPSVPAPTPTPTPTPTPAPAPAPTPTPAPAPTPTPAPEPLEPQPGFQLPDVPQTPPGWVRMPVGDIAQKARADITRAAGIASENKASYLNIQAAAPNITQGPLAGANQKWAEWIRLFNSDFDKQVANYEDFVKNGETLVRNVTRASDAAPAAIQLVMTRNSMPHPSMSPQGLRVVSNQLIGLSDYQIAANRAMSIYDQQSADKGNFPQWWASHFSVHTFMVARMDENDRRDLLNTLNKTATGRAEQQDIMRQLDLINKMGLQERAPVSQAQADLAASIGRPTGANDFRVRNGKTYYKIGKDWFDSGSGR